MRIAHTDPNRYGESTHVHGGAGTIRFLSLWNSDAFETPWLFVHRAELPPKTGIGYHAHDTCEEMFTILDNAARFMHNGNTAELDGPVTVPCRAGEVHGIYNHTDRPTQFMNFCVVGPSGSYDCRDFGENLVNSVPGPADKLPVGRFDRTLLSKASGVHHGKGELGFRRVWSTEDFKTTWGFVDHILIPPDSSIGYHRHDTIEECYIILAGSGRITVDDETELVVTGDAIPNRLGGAHGIYNHTQDNLEVLNMAVCMEKGKFDSTDLLDDLSGR
ncbi:cupin domain-containing protein [bacterium]|nr:cupin domain-containing protein [bacterium]